MSWLWCELAWLGGERATAGVLIEVEGERLATVTEAAAPPPDAERLPGLTLPGLANAHSHAFQRALRGRTQAGTGSFWTWREQMYELAARPRLVLRDLPGGVRRDGAGGHHLRR